MPEDGLRVRGEYRYPDKKKEEAETSTKRYDTPMKRTITVRKRLVE